MERLARAFNEGVSVRHSGIARLVAAALALFALNATNPSANADLSKVYGARIVIADPQLRASKLLAPALNDATKYLSDITGESFSVASSHDDGPAIRLSLAASSHLPRELTARLAEQGIEAFLILSNQDGLEIVANDVHGLSHGLYYYLEALGMRWLLPHTRWTITPRRDDIRLVIDRLEKPLFGMRSNFATGGFFSWRWGHNWRADLPGSTYSSAAMLDWARRLRLGGDIQPARHMGESFNSDPKIRAVLAANPDYLAKIKGKWTPLEIRGADGVMRPNVLAKLNAGNHAAVALFCDWILERLKINRRGPDKRFHTVISVDPADGYDFGDNIEELPGNGSPSDQTFRIANTCARHIRAVFPDVSVTVLAYAERADPPSFDLEPNVIVQLVPYGFQDKPPDQFIAAWRAKTTNLTIYDYWSIPDWSYDEPSFNYHTLAKRLRYWHAMSIRGFHAESTFSSGAIGISHYIASRLLWSLDQDETALFNEWFDLAFGRAKAPMQRMMDRWAASFRLTAAELGTSYRDIGEALRLASGDPEIEARITDFARYLHYLRLRYEIVTAQDLQEREKAAIALIDYLIGVHESLMVHTTRIFDLYARIVPALAAEFAYPDPRSPGPGWQRARILTDANIRSLTADGAAKYPPPDFDSKIFRGDLVPVMRRVWSPPQGDPWGPIMPVVGAIEFDVVIPPGLDHLPLRVSREVDATVTIDYITGQPVEVHQVTRAVSRQNIWAELKTLVAPGHYRVRIHPMGGRRAGFVSFQTWRGIPMALKEFRSPGRSPSPRLYFYVPKGLRHLVMYYPHGDFDGAFGFRIFDADGAAVTPQMRDSRRTFLIDVPAGQDGRIWSMERSVSPYSSHVMLNAPQTFSLEPDTLLVPEDSL